MGLGEALPQGVLQVPADRGLSSEARCLQESDLPGLCPGPRGLALWFPGGQRASRKEKSDVQTPPSRKPSKALGSLSSRRTVLLPPPLTEPYMRFSRIRLFRKSQVEVHMFTQTCGKGTNFFHKQLNLCQFHLWRWLLLVSIL